MYALTIWQPWATLIAEGCKPFEFRGWPLPKRLEGQRIAIHAGSRPARRGEIAELIVKLSGEDRRQTGLVKWGRCMDLLEMWHTSPGMLPLASVLCTAIIGAPIRNEQLAERLGIEWMNDSDRDEHSNWGWPLTEIEPVVPMAPARGAQGFWHWTPDAS